LFIIADKIDSQFKEAESLYRAMILYSLRYARLYKKDDEEKWPPAIKEYFNKILKNTNTTKDFYKVLGQYLVNLMYLDKKWVMANINSIFPSGTKEYWETAFTNYVLFAHKVFQEIYFMLKDAGVWSQALEHTFKEERVIEHTVQHICVSYMESWEELDDNESLINVLITRKNITELAEIVRFISSFKAISDEKRVRIKNLWKALYHIVRGDESKYEIIISNLSGWMALITKIDEESFEWLKLSSRYVDVTHNSSFFIEHLNRLVKVNPKEVGAIYIEMLNANVYPNYEEENIKNIVTILYDEGQKEDADRICTIYMAQQYDFLMPVYEKYN
jgi:predicted RNA-binding protein with EMAP domain